jgi:hypothetical protein
LTKKVRYTKPMEDLMVRLQVGQANANAAPLQVHEKHKLGQLHDLLQKIFTLDPAQRITVEKASAHPFVKED